MNSQIVVRRLALRTGQLHDATAADEMMTMVERMVVTGTGLEISTLLSVSNLPMFIIFASLIGRHTRSCSYANLHAFWSKLRT